MKKKILSIAVMAAVFGLAGCAGNSTPTETDINTTSADTTTQEATTQTEKQTETASTTETETETAQTEEYSDTTSYDVKVKKALDGFSKSGGMTYTEGDSSYTYEIHENISSHAVEADLDSVAASLINGDTGISGDIKYATGRNTSDLNVMKAYKLLGTGSDVNAYISVEYKADGDMDMDTVFALLSDEYINVVEK